MATEIERKFIATGLPRDAVGSYVIIRQGYLAEEGDAEVRVRIIDRGGAAEAVLTVKVGRGRTRTEVELALPAGDAEQLWQHTAGRRIEKVRHLVELGPVVAEVDVFAGALAGMMLVEVEFDSEEAADAFVAPDWFGAEVTGDPAWANASLARRGRPDRP